jgi:hypothetical protein
MTCPCSTNVRNASHNSWTVYEVALCVSEVTVRAQRAGKQLNKIRKQGEELKHNRVSG